MKCLIWQLNKILITTTTILSPQLIVSLYEAISKCYVTFTIDSNELIK